MRLGLLTLLGLGLLALLGLTSVQANEGADLALDSAPTMVRVNETFTVSWNVTLTNLSYDNVTHTALHLGYTSSADNISIANYPFVSQVLQGDPGGGNYSLPLTPDREGTLYFILHAIANGTHYYGPAEYAVMVHPRPQGALVGAPLWVRVGENFTVSWTVTNIAGADLSHTALHYSNTSSASNISVANYPFVSAIRSGTGGSYSVNLTAPEVATTLYLILHSIIDGVPYYSPTEFTIQVRALPELTLALAPASVTTGSEFTLGWTISEVAGTDLPHTAVHYGNATGGAPPDIANYAGVSAIRSGTGGSYSVNLTAPEQAGTLYFLLHAVIDGDTYYSKAEYALRVTEAQPADFIVIDVELKESGGTGGQSWSIDPGTLTLHPGTQVHFRIWNNGSAPHNLKLEAPVDKVSPTITGGQQTWLNVTLPAQQGLTLAYWCDVPGHRALGMEGELVVSAATPGDDDTDDGDESTPGFTGLLMVVGLAAGVLLVKRRR